ncbi:transglutaminase-like domain-containing protein [Devosia nitrariae]|uniref:Transglutaminase-like domain-containing protein n=1 Tax=Devosia nitrariae TaxID=2071872 RepID=A0ABQ5W1Z3_9HYPH|nr:transglutaminase-like domain-containing protein [Devosia nitrariae]GLQ54080.1 hypothetical protein GCM10010862_13390 [Devosia nitrariae]
MNVASFYTAQSTWTDPGRYAPLFDALPDDIAVLCAVVRNITLHYRAGPRVGFDIPKERLAEIDTRFCELMLERIIALDARPLAEPRAPTQRVIGCCRDASLLLCSMLRHKGVPARIRYGFAPYLSTNRFNGDHAVVEYWNGTRWLLADAEQAGPEIAFGGTAFSPLDIQRGPYLTAGMAWHLVRSGQAKEADFGVSPELHGLPEIRVALLVDIAMLNRCETLLWDVWGIGEIEHQNSADDLALLDRAASLSADTDVEAGFAGIKEIFLDERMRVPQTVTSLSPAQGPRQVMHAVLDSNAA